MTHRFRVVLAVLGVASASLTLASCGRRHERVTVSRPAPRPSPAIQPAVDVPRTSASEAVWSVRAGLNVAALSCRGQGRQPVLSGYTEMLARHRALLAAAYHQEQGRQGTAFDRQQTRIYNTFANQPSPERFCSAASAAADRVNRLDSAAFAMAAPRLLGELKAALVGHP